MERIKPDRITDVLDALIGPVNATGNSAKDEEIEKNLDSLVWVATWCIESLADSTYDRDRPEGSMKAIGQKAFDSMKRFRDWLKEATDEEGE